VYPIASPIGPARLAIGFPAAGERAAAQPRSIGASLSWGRWSASPSSGYGSSVDDDNKPRPVFAGFTKAQLQLLAIGAVAMLLPLLFIIIIFVINFGGSR
jgi:hypothetical protein